MPEETQQPLQLFLHIGVHKTGSTSLQLRFFRNPDTLRRQGILYPLGRFENHPYQHSEITRLTAPGTLSELESLLRAIRGEADESGCRKVVLSGEDISLLQHRRLGVLRDALRSAGFHTVVVVFFRHYVDYVRSLASEDMKMRGHFVTPAWLAARLRRLPREEVVDRFQAVFGAENVIRHDLAAGEDCVALFDKDIGLTADLASPRVNTRIDFATASWMNAVKDDLDVPLAIPVRLYGKAFGRRMRGFTSEEAFFTEVADLVGGEKGETLKGQLRPPRDAADDLSSIEAQIRYLDDFHRFIGHLRRFLWRRALRRRLMRLVGRGGSGSGGTDNDSDGGV